MRTDRQTDKKNNDEQEEKMIEKERDNTNNEQTNMRSERQARGREQAYRNT